MKKITKKDLNPNIHIQEGNTVLVDNEEYGFLIFSLPARDCCPYATELCRKICYGRNAQELFKHVYDCRKRNFEESLKDNFVEDMIEILTYNLQRKKYKNKTILFRIHETEDMYSQEYTDKWIEIANYFKNNSRIVFQSYTKSLAYIKEKTNSSNIKFMFSIMQDTKIEDIELAHKLKLNTFEALPSILFEKVHEQHKCIGDCSKCKECYLGSKDMIVEYHGNRVPGKSSVARVDYGKQIYWSWKYKKIL